MFSPEEFMQYNKKRGKYPKFRPPKGVIFCYDRSLMKYVVDNHSVRKVEGFHGDIYLIGETGGQVAIIGNFGIGAPVVVTLLEELIAFGVKEFVSIGLAGSLQKSLDIGDLVVCDRAIRDEGTSYHYLKSSKFAVASKAMTKRITCALDSASEKYVVGTSWTVDAPYRETVAEAKRYQKEGVLTVEMEASALFAVAKYRNVDIGAIFTISDSLAELEWKPKFHARKTKRGLEDLYRLAIDVLTEE
jgi:uridine phosphorylase